jgi:uncharacterized ferredoxin-like protein
MRFNSVKSGNFTSAAKAVNRSADQMFQASRESAPDFTGISKAAIASRAKERNAAISAKGVKEVANIKADNLIDRTKLNIKTQKDVADIKRPAKRMAGVVAGLGSIATAAMLNKDNKEAKAERLQFRQEQAAITAKTMENFNTSQKSTEDMMAQLRSTLKPLDTSTTGDSTATGAAVSDSDPTPRSVSTYKGGKLTQAQGTQLLIDQGMDPENARIGGAVMMAESGGNPGARSHPDLEARTGEMSVGLWQHNKNTGEDRHGFYGIQDWSELNTPETNARATYRLWDRRGGWGDWGAYTNGSYKKFL